jgi:hypothetical protein
MTTWTEDELRRIGTATELQLASRRGDGTLRPYVTMWVVGFGNEIYVRSAGGPDRPWYRHARASGSGHIRAGGVQRDVTFGEATTDVQEEIDDTYHAKYDDYGQSIVGHVVGPQAHDVTIRLLPDDPSTAAVTG